jgi:DNA-binding transcriptional MerR regulator
MDGLLLKSGEFAYLCATTKETLRHYRNIGLLCPAQVTENGYQYYSVMQILDFLLISALRSADCSLQEIKGYLTMPSAEDLKSTLIGMLETIESEKRDILRKERLLKNTIARLDLLTTAPEPGKCYVETCSPEYYIQTPIVSKTSSDEDVTEALREHLHYCREHFFGEEFQFTYRIGREAFLSGDYLSDISLCSRVSPKTRSKRLYIKPKGLYLKLLRQATPSDGADDEMALEMADAWFSSFNALKTHAINNGYRVIGDVYETELSVYTGNTRDSLTSELAILVTKEQ